MRTRACPESFARRAALAVTVRRCLLALLVLGWSSAGCIKDGRACKQDTDCFAGERCASSLCVAQDPVADMRAADLPPDADMPAQDMPPDMPPDVDMGEAVCPACPDGSCCKALLEEGEIEAFDNTTSGLKLFITSDRRLIALALGQPNTLRAFTWDGAKWSNVTVTTSPAGPQAFAGALDDQDVLHIAYLEGDAVSYRTLTTAGLTPPEVIATCAADRQCTHAADLVRAQDGKLHAAWISGQDGQGWEVFTATRQDSGQWLSASLPVTARANALRVAVSSPWMRVFYQRKLISPNAPIFEASLRAGTSPVFFSDPIAEHDSVADGQIALHALQDASIALAINRRSNLLWARNADALQELSTDPHAAPLLTRAPGAETVRGFYLREARSRQVVVGHRAFVSTTDEAGADAVLVNVEGVEIVAGAATPPLLGVALGDERVAHIMYRTTNGKIQYRRATLP